MCALVLCAPRRCDDDLRAVPRAAGLRVAHNDLKPDNVFIRCSRDHRWELFTGRCGCWPDIGLFIIDLGLSEELVHLNKEQRRKVMDADLLGICDCIHAMLFGVYLVLAAPANATEPGRAGPQAADTAPLATRRRLKTRFKRYHHPVWEELFDVMLNVTLGEESAAMERLCAGLTAHLAQNAATLTQEMIKHHIFLGEAG